MPEREKVDSEFEGTERFAVRRRLGAGAMGVVYEVFDRDLNRRAALKALRKLTPRTLQFFKREFRAMQGIEHPNLVRLGELINSGDTWFFTMEYVEGVDFLKYIGPRGDARRDTGRKAPLAATHDTEVEPPRMEDGEAHRRSEEDEGDETKPGELVAFRAPARAAELFDEPRLRATLAQVAEGIAAIHQSGKVHRDIKPANVLVTAEGRAVLLDFGIVSDIETEPEIGARRRGRRDPAGTVAYMAPEQALSTPVAPALDWYAFGVLLYRALTGKLPFQGPSSQIIENKQRYEPPPPSVLVEGVPDDLNQLCMELLRFDPKARPTDQQVLDRLGVTRGADSPDGPGSMSSLPTQTMPFIGRVRELATLHRAVLDSADGAILVLVHGETGVGKSELVRHFATQVERDDPNALILMGTCFEREAVPFKAWDDIIEELSDFLSSLSDAEVDQLLPPGARLLPQLFPTLGRVEAFNVGADATISINPLEHRTQGVAALRELFARLARQRRVVLTIDDFQWVDPDGLHLLAEFLHGPDAPHVLVAATVLEGEGRMWARVLEQPLGEDVRKLRLEGLPPEDSLELIGVLAPDDTAIDEAVAQSIASESGGHPLFIQELVRHARDEGGHRAGSLRLDDALSARIARLPPDATRLLATLCVAGSPTPHEVAQMAAELDGGLYEKAVALLRVAFFARTTGARRLDTIDAYHNRVRSTVLARLTAAEIRHYHTRLARALERTGVARDDPNALVRHLEAAGEPARAAHYAEESAARAARALAFEQAAALCRTALRLGEFAGERARALRLQLGDALVNCGRGAEAATVFDAAAEGADPATRLDCRRKAAEQLLSSGHIERGIDAVRTLLGEIGVPFPESQTAVMASLLWNRARLRLRGLRWKERHPREIADSELTRLEVYKGVAQGLGLVDTVRGMDFQVRGLLLALEIGEKNRVARSLLYETCFLASQGGRQFGRVWKLLELATKIAQRSDDPYLASWHAGTVGFISYFSSDFETGAAAFAVAEAKLRDETKGLAWELGTVRQFRLQCLWHMGAFKQLRRGWESYLRDAVHRGDRYAEITMRRSCNLVHLVDGDVERARRDLELEWVGVERGHHLQHFYALRAHVEIALYCGEAAARLEDLTPMFEQFLGSLMKRLQLVRASLVHLYGRVLVAAAAQTDGRTALLRRAARCARRLEREPAAFAKCWGHLLFAAIASQKDDRQRAIAELHEAIEHAQKNAQEAHVAAARWRLGNLLGGEEGAASTAAAREWLSAEEIEEPERFLEVLAPGLG